MSTGGLHPLAAKRRVKHDLWPRGISVSWTGLKISVCDRILSAQVNDRLILWGKRKGAPNLVLMDTSILPGSSAAPRVVRFVCDPRYCGLRLGVMAGEAAYNDFSEGMGPEVLFYPDPSQRVIACPLYSRDRFSKVRGILLVHSETLLRLARETGGGVIEWDTWGKFTVALDADKVPGFDWDMKCSVSGSRFMTVDTSEAERWAKSRVYDFSHWGRQHPDTEPDRLGSGDSDRKRARYRLTERVSEPPECLRNIYHAAMLWDSLVFFSVGPDALCFWSRRLTDPPQFDEQRPKGDFYEQRTLDIWSLS
jgi:hypothetical protein